MITDNIVDAFLAAYAKSNADVRAGLEAVAPMIRNAALEEARRVAKASWLTVHFGEIVDADALSAVCEHAADGIEALKSGEPS